MTSDPPSVDRRLYAPDGKQLSAFLQDFSFFTSLRGPVGSGKSASCCIKAYQVAHFQQPSLDGIRRTKGVVVRRTFDQLKRTTLRTWLTWFPELVYPDLKIGPPIIHTLREPGYPYCWGCRRTLLQGSECTCKNARVQQTTIEAEAHFLPVESDDDIEKLKSFEITWFWVNEGRYLQKIVTDTLLERCRGYPTMLRDPVTDEVIVEPTWVGGWQDTNAPEEDHWIPIMEGSVLPPEWMDDELIESLRRPANWQFYIQPPALLEQKNAEGMITGYTENSVAENRKWLAEGYWLRLAQGKTRGYIETELQGRLGVLRHGKPVWPTFSKDRNVSDVLSANPHLPVWVGFDSTGLNPAAVIAQRHGLQWRILREVVGRDVTAENFAPALRMAIAEMFPGLDLREVNIFRDPHMEKSQIDNRTVDAVFRKHGMILRPAPGGNGVKHRIETVAGLWDTRGGVAGILVSRNCVGLIAACDGGYHYRKMKITGSVRYEAQPFKGDRHADVADALQYVVLGGGEGRQLMQGTKKAGPVDTLRRLKFGRRQALRRAV